MSASPKMSTNNISSSEYSQMTTSPGTSLLNTFDRRAKPIIEVWSPTDKLLIGSRERAARRVVHPSRCAETEVPYIHIVMSFPDRVADREYRMGEARGHV